MPLLVARSARGTGPADQTLSSDPRLPSPLPRSSLFPRFLGQELAADVVAGRNLGAPKHDFNAWPSLQQQLFLQELLDRADKVLPALASAPALALALALAPAPITADHRLVCSMVPLLQPQLTPAPARASF